MPRIRVLVVDDSVVVRRLLAEALGRDPELTVVGTASSGAVALAKVNQLDPDVVTLDVEMEGLSGLETLRWLRRTHERLPVIMFSVVTQRGASATVEALLLGARDCVAKPFNLGPREVEEAQAELAQRIKALARPAGRAAGPAPVPAPRPRTGLVDVVAIGVSTGGPNALMDLLTKLPADFPAPIVIVQHMPAMFTRLLAEALAARCALRVAEGVHGGRVEAGTVWLAPGGEHHTTLAHDGGEVRLRIAPGPPENACRPSADVLLRSAAEVYGPGTLALVMTGMGQDGLRGCEHVREAGGEVLVQDEASSVVWGMPGFVVRAGLADAVVPLADLPHELLRRARRGRTADALAARAP